MAGSLINSSVKFFEQTRSILWNRLLDQHIDVTEAEGKVPELVEEFRKLQVTVNAPRRPLALADRVDGMISSEPDPYKEASDCQCLLQKIQAVPGLEDFPAPPFDDKNFTRYAMYGPVVILNCMRNYGHVVLITKNGMLNLNLPDFEETLGKLLYEKLQESFDLWRKEVHEEAAAIYFRILNTLWQTAAKPIIEKLYDVCLQKGRPKGADLPRLWWITTGYVNLLPIHAAGE